MSDRAGQQKQWALPDSREKHRPSLPRSFVWAYVSPIPPPPQTARAWHCTTRLENDAVLAPQAVDRRGVVRAILKHGPRAGLIAYCVVDTHLHALFVGKRVVVGEAMRRIELSCHRRLNLEHRFDGARILPIRDQRHLRNVVPYILNQLARHEVLTDPLQEGSALHDLLGLRVPGAHLVGALQAEQPRLVIEQMWTSLGVQPAEVDSWGRPLEEEELALVDEATRSAFAIGRVRRRGHVHRLVRAAMVQAADGHSGRSIERSTGLSHTTVRGLRKELVPRSWIEAIRRQVRLRRWAMAQAGAEGSLPSSDPVY